MHTRKHGLKFRTVRSETVVVNVAEILARLRNTCSNRLREALQDFRDRRVRRLAE